MKLTVSARVSTRQERVTSRVWEGVYTASMALSLLVLTLLLMVSIEARVFSNQFPRERPWTSVRCFPIATLADTTVTVRAVLRNPLDRKLTRYVVTLVPVGSVLLVERTAERIVLAPRERVELRYAIPVEYRVYGRMLMWAGKVQRSYPMPMEAGSCGILVLPIPVVPGWLAGLGLLALTLIVVTVDLYRGAAGVRKGIDLMLAAAYLALFFFNAWAVAAFLWLCMAIALVWAGIKRTSGIALSG